MACKIIYLQKRRAGDDVAGFQARLSELCKLDPDIPGLVSYVQSHTLLKGYAKGDLFFDVVEEFLFDSSAMAEYFWASDIQRSIAKQREEAIDGTRSITMLVDVHRVRNAPVPSTAVKNIEFVNKRADIDLRDFRRYWRETHGPLAATIPSILRYEQNHLTLKSYDADIVPRFDGLAITWFESTAAMRQGAESQAYADTRADESNFLPDGHLPILITQEVLFK